MPPEFMKGSADHARREIEKSPVTAARIAIHALDEAAEDFDHIHWNLVEIEKWAATKTDEEFPFKAQLRQAVGSMTLPAFG